MSEQSAKPYLVRAICEWCADNGLTPYIAVKVNSQTRVPPAFVKNGEIVLNISRGATRRLTIDKRMGAIHRALQRDVAGSLRPHCSESPACLPRNRATGLRSRFHRTP